MTRDERVTPLEFVVASLPLVFFFALLVAAALYGPGAHWEPY